MMNQVVQTLIKVKNFIFSPGGDPALQPQQNANNQPRKRKFNNQQIPPGLRAELTEDEEEIPHQNNQNNQFQYSFKRKKVDHHNYNYNYQQSQNTSHRGGPAEEKYFETNYNFTTNSTYPYYPNLMAMQTRIEDKDKKKHVTRGSGLSQPVLDDGSGDGQKKLTSKPKKFELINLSDDEDDVIEDPDIELKNGTLRTIKAKKTVGVFHRSLNHSPGPANKIVKRRKYPATFRLFEKWFPEKTTSIFSKLDTKTNRPEEKNCYIQLIKANLSKNNAYGQQLQLPLRKSSISNEDTNWNNLYCGGSSSSSNKSQNCLESTVHLFSTRLNNDNYDHLGQTGSGREKAFISRHLSNSLISNLLKDPDYTRWDPKKTSTPFSRPPVPPRQQPEVITLDDKEGAQENLNQTQDTTKTEGDTKSNNNDDEVSIIHEIINTGRDYKKPCSLELEQSFTHLTDKKWSEGRRRSFDESKKDRERKIQEELKTLELLKSESRIEKDLNERLRRKLTLTGVIELEEQLPEITEEMMAIIQNANSGGSMNQVLNTLFNIDITRADIKTLAPCKWLNDNVINAYMEMIAQRSKGDGYRSAYPFTTFFYPKFLKEGHSNILKRWTRKVDIFSYKLLFFPIHLGLHWCLAVADLEAKTIKYYDSLGGRNDQCLKALLRYLKSELKERKKEDLIESDWDLENVQGIPQQENGSDCGMFACKFAEYISRGSDISGVQQEDMNYFRQRLVYELVKNELLYP